MLNSAPSSCMEKYTILNIYSLSGFYCSLPYNMSVKCNNSIGNLIFQCTFFYLCSAFLMTEQVCDDWIISGELLAARYQHGSTHFAAEFILLTAHSALLWYSVGTPNEEKLKSPRSLFQIMEENDIRISKPDCRLFLKKKVLCEERCILFSGSISLERSERCCMENIPTEALDALSKKMWDRVVCFGGTSFGGIIIWGPDGDVEGDFIKCWHSIKAHKVSLCFFLVIF